jgi:hypothetical protein
VRTIIETFEVGLGILGEIMELMPGRSTSGLHFCICHSDGLVERNIDLEMGCLLETKTHEPVTLHNDLTLTFRELPAVETMATTIVKGPLETIHTGYTEIGKWTEIHGFRLGGQPREICLQLPDDADGSDLVTEIQFPVKQIL